jgi:hypothetical protein
VSIDPRLPRHIRARAEALVLKLRAGATWLDLGGHKLNHDRTLVSIPLGVRYRLVARIESGAIVPLSVMSHETYNNWLRKR